MQRVVITGASSGIGAALARHYAQSGAVLGLIARRSIELEKLAVQLAAPVRIYPVDVRHTSALQAAAADFIAHYGSPDIVIGNAGVSFGTLSESAEDIAAFQDVIDINIMGLVKTFQPFIAGMRAAGRGTLVGIASLAGYRGLPGAGAYSASKAAAISYLESLRVELQTSAIKVITVCPGYIATPMTANNPYPMPFIIEADDAARRIVRVLDSSKSFAVIPWQMAIVGRLLKLVPNAIFDRMMQGRGHKPRKS